MHWSDEAIVINSRKHGETSAILEVMTANHGRHLGLVRGGAGKRIAAILQAGNKLKVRWNARLDSHLGVFTVEPIQQAAPLIITNPACVYLLQTILSHTHFIAERDPHNLLYRRINDIIDGITRNTRRITPLASAFILFDFEHFFLAELGFSLDFSSCAATGITNNLIYVSPKSGRAVSARAGKPFHNLMLKLPSFLLTNKHDTINGESKYTGIAPDKQDVSTAFALYGFFLQRNLYDHFKLKLPYSRHMMLTII